MTIDKESAAMVPQPLKVRKDQKEFLDSVKDRTGNASHFIRVALDIHIEREKAKTEGKSKA